MKFIDAFGRDNTWGGIEGVCACVGEGWTPLIKRLVEDLEKLGWDGELHQVKEKYGGLRFYIGGGTNAIFDRIQEAEAESEKMCEKCGAPGKLRGKFWVYTACDAHTDPKDLDEADRSGT